MNRQWCCDKNELLVQRVTVLALWLSGCGDSILRCAAPKLLLLLAGKSDSHLSSWTTATTEECA